MKIFFRLSRLGYGGTERVFLSVAEYLHRVVGFDVAFVVDIDEGACVETARESGFVVHSLGVTRTLKSILPFKKLIEVERPDVVVSAYPDTNFAALISNLLCKHACCIIVTEHSSIKDHFSSRPWYRRLMVRIFVAYGYRLADHVVCVSEGLMYQVQEFLGKNKQISTIYNPVRFVDSNTNHPHVVASRQTQLLSVGRMTEQKDYLTLLRALCIVRQNCSVHLKIVGGMQDTEEVIRLKAFIGDNDLHGCVELIDHTDDIACYYRSADIFILSSAWEGFGNVLVEALAFGLPVVSTDCNCGPSEILCGGKYGKLIPVGDFEAMAVAIESVLLSNPFVMAQQRERALDFSESKVGQQYQSLIESLLEVK